MTLPLAVRSLRDSERNMCLANWKKDLSEARAWGSWGAGLGQRNYWCLINHVLDRITLPSCDVWVGCHTNDPETPICWVATRRIEGLQLHAIVYLYVRQQLRDDPELAITLERALLSEVETHHPLATERRPYNPFLELDRP